MAGRSVRFEENALPQQDQPDFPTPLAPVLHGECRGVGSPYWRGMRQWLRAGVDFLYPPCCVLCDAETASGGDTDQLCPRCRAELLQEQGPACLRCGAPVGPHLNTVEGCVFCRDDQFAFTEVFRLGIYEKLLRTACLRGKLRGAEGLLTALAKLTWKLGEPRFRGAGIDLVIPVPHHWTQRMLRPLNPAEILAWSWSRLLNAECAPHLLRKSRRTPAQARLSPTERRLNLRDAFTIREKLEGANILLADDVLTTGTTAHQAARVLKAAGANRVIVAVLARGIGKK